MILPIFFALTAGALVSLSRQINGRLALSTTPLIASFWNHLVGFVALSVLGLIISGLVPPGAADAPWHAYVGGPIGVVFVAAGSFRRRARSAAQCPHHALGQQPGCGAHSGWHGTDPASIAQQKAPTA